MTNRAISYLEEVGENRYREHHGLYFEDFVIGDVIEHRPGRTITEVDNIWQSLINMNPHPLHFDHAYCQETEFKKPLVSSLVTLSIVCGLSVASTSRNGIANLGWRSIQLTHPVFVGDTLFAETAILHKRISKSRPQQGIVTVETRGITQQGVKCITFERSFLVPMHNPARESV